VGIILSNFARLSHAPAPGGVEWDCVRTFIVVVYPPEFRRRMVELVRSGRTATLGGHLACDGCGHVEMVGRAPARAPAARAGDIAFRGTTLSQYVKEMTSMAL